ncbi:hypothetical protein BGX26_011708 [Mortierella sp. AD094]|nr:hypothetical protein BGX26_011708 [Mortierella sp. AD094]
MRFVATMVIALVMSALTTADTTFQVFITDPNSSTVWIAGRPATVKWILSISPTNATLTGSLPVELVGGKSFASMNLITVLGSGSFDANSLIVKVPDNANRGPDYVYSVRFGGESYSELFTIKESIIIGGPEPITTATKTSTTFTPVTTTLTKKTTKTKKTEPPPTTTTASATNITKANTTHPASAPSITKKPSGSFTLPDATIRTTFTTTTVQFPAQTTSIFPTFTGLDVSPSLTSTVPFIAHSSTNSVPMSNNRNAGPRHVPVMRFSTFAVAALATLASAVFGQVNPSHPRQGDIWILKNKVAISWAPKATAVLPIQLLSGPVLSAQRVVADLGKTSIGASSLTITVPDQPVGWYSIRIGDSYSHIFAIQKDAKTPPSTPEPTAAPNVTTTTPVAPIANATSTISVSLVLPTTNSSSTPSSQPTTTVPKSAASYLKAANVKPLAVIAAAAFLSAMAL